MESDNEQPLVAKVWNAIPSDNNPYTTNNLSWSGVIQPISSVEFGMLGKNDNSTVV
jgi:hypothetical protein